MKKITRILSLILSSLLFLSVFSCLPLSVSAEAFELPANTVCVDLTLTAADGSTVTFEHGGKTYSAVVGKTIFSKVSAAAEVVPAGGTLWLGAGEYTEGVTFKNDITIEGPKAGINPNVKGSDNTVAWTRNPERGDGEAVLKTSWHMGINANTGVYDAHTITVDGLAVTGAGMFRSNLGKEGNIKLTYKNMLVYGYTTANNGPFYCYSYYPDRSTNLYVRDVVAENIRFEGQTTAPGFNLTVESFTATGICFDSASTKGMFEYVTVNAAGSGDVKLAITDCQFCQNRIGVIGMNFSKMAGGHGFNLNIADKKSVTATVENCTFFVPAANSDGKGVVTENKESDNVTITVQNNTIVAEKPETTTPDDTHYDLEKELTWYGRTYAATDAHYFNWSGSGFSFTFKGSSAQARFVSSAPAGGNNAFLKIYVDGVEQPDVELTKLSQIVTLATGLDASKEHTVKVLKRTNLRSSSAGVVWISINEGGTKLSAPAAKTRLIEFIGDSLTVGYGSIGEGATAWSTSTEDVTKTYIPAIAEACDAEYGVIACSGRGIAHNYGGDTDKLIPYLYTKLDEYNNPGVNWDYSIKPDVIVINMGTNDESAMGQNGSTREGFVAAYQAFIEDLHKNLPDTKIIVCYNLTSRGLESTIADMVDGMVKAGASYLSYVKLTTCKTTELNLGHPNQAGYEKNVDKLVEAIMTATNWNGTEETTAPETEAETAAPETVPATEAQTEVQTEAAETAAPEVQETEVPAADTDATKKSGCGSAASSAAAAVLCLATAFAVRRKKED